MGEILITGNKKENYFRVDDSLDKGRIFVT